MIISVVCPLVRCLLGCLTVLIRHQVPQDAEPVNLAGHWIHRKQVLGGLTHEYYAAA